MARIRQCLATFAEHRVASPYCRTSVVVRKGRPAEL